ncbi:uncharacterized protein LOC133896882 [Phragmites australis]|uniref:uncharacterized protein LOC133896882 n=1 Tax=Phragmites australis TaxID=29695 RepID=UPI002D782EEC|nr:uncharacterized protein LOC133896882 [Phragmites australis]
MGYTGDTQGIRRDTRGIRPDPCMRGCYWNLSPLRRHCTGQSAGTFLLSAATAQAIHPPLPLLLSADAASPPVRWRRLPSCLPASPPLLMRADMPSRRNVPRRFILGNGFLCRQVRRAASSSSADSGLPPSSKKRKGKQSEILESFNAETRHIANGHIARLFYTAGLPFNVARNPNYRSSYNFVANNKMGGYVPPGYNALRTTLLQKEKAHVERMLQPIKSTWPFNRVTIAADGWTDPQRRPILNFIAVTEGAPIFLKSIDSEGEVKSKEYIFDRLKEVIEEVGSKNVVQVITDNAANCKAVGLMIESKYKNIFWTPCVVHTLNLALKNICAPKDNEGDNKELVWIKHISEDAFYIKNYIMNHGMRLSMFNEFTKLKFLAVAETRFASVIVMLKRFLLIKEALMLMVVGDKWMAYREDNPTKAQAVKEKIINDIWWDQVQYIVDFTDPIYSMLRAADTDKPCLY